MTDTRDKITNIYDRILHGGTSRNKKKKLRLPFAIKINDNLTYKN